MKVQIIDINPMDAYYEDADRLLDQVVEVKGNIKISPILQHKACELTCEDGITRFFLAVKLVYVPDTERLKEVGFHGKF